MKPIAGIALVILALLSGCASSQGEIDTWTEYLWGNFGGKSGPQYPDLNAGGGGGW